MSLTTRMMRRGCYIAVLALSTIGSLVNSFSPIVTRTNQHSRLATIAQFHAKKESEDESSNIQVVLFGKGDYRIQDHLGFQAALDSQQPILPLAVISSGEEDPLEYEALKSLKQQLQTTCQLELQLTNNLPAILADLPTSSTAPTVLHVCDLGHVNNELSNNPLHQLLSIGIKNDDYGFDIQKWNCHLRPNQAESFDLLFPQYEKTVVKKIPVLSPRKTTTTTSVQQTTFSSKYITSTLPSSTTSSKNVGLYGTHWGGLDCSLTMNEAYCLEVLENPDIIQDWKTSVNKNPNSLEHATMEWNDENNVLFPNEKLIRFLMAPVEYGLLSPRQVYPYCQEWMESREWHQVILANSKQSSKQTYKYWKWHGFTCRYLTNSVEQQPGEEEALDETDTNDPSLVWVHGFGASCAQIEPCLEYLSSQKLYAPDLLGFGQNEKPPITYTQYLWSMFVSNFIQTIVQERNFVVSGNSIGGYTALMTAADSATADAATTSQECCSSSGDNDNGNKKCVGLILMNSAGKIVDNEDGEESEGMSVAQQTLEKNIPSPTLPQWFARLGGNGLLAYLRPNIQKICVNLYPTNPNAVTKELSQRILRDSLDPGAINVMISGSKLPPPRTINDLLGSSASSSIKESVFEGPVLVAQGMLDPLNDAKTRANQILSMRPTSITLSPLNAGHCPHDELPQDMAQIITHWMTTTGTTTTKMSKSKADSPMYFMTEVK